MSHDIVKEPTRWRLRRPDVLVPTLLVTAWFLCVILYAEDIDFNIQMAPRNDVLELIASDCFVAFLKSFKIGWSALLACAAAILAPQLRAFVQLTCVAVMAVLITIDASYFTGASDLFALVTYFKDDVRLVNDGELDDLNAYVSAACHLLLLCAAGLISRDVTRWRLARLRQHPPTRSTQRNHCETCAPPSEGSTVER